MINRELTPEEAQALVWLHECFTLRAVGCNTRWPMLMLICAN